MALAYDSRRATRDEDALFKPHGIVLEEARAVGAELGLPSWRDRRSTRSFGMKAFDCPLVTVRSAGGPCGGRRQELVRMTRRWVARVIAT